MPLLLRKPELCEWLYSYKLTYFSPDNWFRCFFSLLLLFFFFFWDLPHSCILFLGSRDFADKRVRRCGRQYYGEGLIFPHVHPCLLFMAHFFPHSLPCILSLGSVPWVLSVCLLTWQYQHRCNASTSFISWINSLLSTFHFQNYVRSTPLLMLDYAIFS